jgi:hypothetical protein
VEESGEKNGVKGMGGTEESVRRLRDELAAAVGRGRRARREAHSRVEDFQRHTTELAQSQQREAQPADRVVTATEFRARVGLPVETGTVAESTFPADATEKSHQQTPSDGSDEDFSQARMLR